jgi:hypothetical protein
MVRHADLGQAVQALMNAADTTIGAQQYWVTFPWP